MSKRSNIKIRSLSKRDINVKTLSSIDKDSDARKLLYVANSRSGHNYIKDNIISWMGFETIEESGYEYRNLENYKIDKFEDGIKTLSIDLYENAIKVLSIRDLLNWYTSYFYLFNNMIPVNHFKIEDISDLSFKITNPLTGNYRVIEAANSDIKKVYEKRYKPKSEKLINQLNLGLDSWLMYAKEFKGETNFLKGFTHIYYDDFFKDKNYRIQICENLGGIYNERKLNVIPKTGNYSTFDNDHYQNDGQNMTKVLERYKNWKPEHKEFLDILFKHDAFEYYLYNFEINEDKFNFIADNK